MPGACYSSTSFVSRRRSRGSVGERPLHTRKVAGSIPAGTTLSGLHEHGLCTLWLIRFIRFLSDDRRIDRLGCAESVEMCGDLDFALKFRLEAFKCWVALSRSSVLPCT